jgi:peptide deformylase
MKIIPIHYNQSVPVTAWLAIEADAKAIAEMIDNSYEDRSFAVHHNQVSEKPYNFFVLNPKHIMDKVAELGSRYIINPRISGVEPKSLMYLKEGCLSFPHKKMKNVDRYMLINVEFDIPENGQLVHKKFQVTDIVAQIFQHECDHAEGRNIHFSS